MQDARNQGLFKTGGGGVLPPTHPGATPSPFLTPLGSEKEEKGALGEVGNTLLSPPPQKKSRGAQTGLLPVCFILGIFSERHLDINHGGKEKQKNAPEIA